MYSLEAEFLHRQHIPASLMRSIRLIGELKGKQALYERRAPEILESLQQAAVIHSTESSNRIEGVVAPRDRIEQIVGGARPRNRSEQEIAGYRDVLATVHVNAANMRPSSGLVRQLHRDLFAYMPSGGGDYKPVDNDITETRADGTRFVRFRPVSAHQTAAAMDELHRRFNLLWHEGTFDPLLLIPAYVLDFLCIHPFLDGNGRMARLLTLMLLYQGGYEVGRYVSLERIIEATKEGYYDTLFRSSQGWHDAGHSLVPWWEYFLGVMLTTAYRELDASLSKAVQQRGAKAEMVRNAIKRLPDPFRISDVERAVTGVSRPTITRVLTTMRREGLLVCPRGGRDAVWQRVEALPETKRPRRHRSARPRKKKR